MNIFELRIKQSYGKLVVTEKGIDAMELTVLTLTHKNLDNYNI